MPKKGRYLYGIVASEESASFGNIGIDDSEVYSVPYRVIAAIVHDCDEEAYSSDDKEMIKNWVISHQAVVDKVWEKYGVIVPVVFDTIIKGETETLKGWLEENYDSLVIKLTRFAKKAEYGVQILWDIKKISEEVVSRDEELLGLQKQIQSASEGTSHLYKKKMEQLLRSRLEERSLGFFQSNYDTIKEAVDDIVIERLKPPTEGRQMLLNVSCLVSKDCEKKLGKLLDEMNREGYDVRFTGPWPPYSFVGKS